MSFSKFPPKPLPCPAPHCHPDQGEAARRDPFSFMRGERILRLRCASLRMTAECCGDNLPPQKEKPPPQRWPPMILFHSFCARQMTQERISSSINTPRNTPLTIPSPKWWKPASPGSQCSRQDNQHRSSQKANRQRQFQI